MSDINPLSLEWKIISDYLKDRLSELRAENDKLSSIEKTSFTRGQIKEVKLLLKLPEVKPESLGRKVDYGFDD